MLISTPSITTNPQHRKPNKQRGPLSSGSMVQAGAFPAGDSVKFGANRKNGIWVTTERLPAKAGGLGEVSKTIPDAISKYTDKDMRIIIPYEKANLNHDQKNPGNAFQKTNLTLTVQPNKGQPPIVFEVLQKFEPAINAENNHQGNWVYALKTPLFMENPSNEKDAKGKTKDEGLSQYTYNGKDQKALQKVLLFNQAAGQLIPYLSQDGPELPPVGAGEQALHRFKGHTDFVIGNDWLTGPVLYQHGVQGDPKIRKVFMLHNTYDQMQGAGFIEHIGQAIPVHLTKVTDDYSPLELSLQSADGVIGNRNFVKTITETKFKQGQKFVEILKTHSQQGRVFDMHHGLAEDFTPKHNQALREDYAVWQDGTIRALKAVVAAPADKRAKIEEDVRNDIIKSAPRLNDKLSQYLDAAIKELEAGKEDTAKAAFPSLHYQFQELPGDTPNDWKIFKDANKLALQTKYGLNKDPDAVLVSWAARLDPYQKGFYMVQNALRELLDKNPKLQIIIAGATEKDPSVDAWIKRMNEDPQYQGRFYMPNQFVNKTAINQINAGSDFVMLPSLYEPYGLTQLEAMKMGAIPVVHGVDGIRTTVSDPAVNGKDFIGRSKTGKDDFLQKDEAAWFDPKTGKEWQTGILMRPMNENVAHNRAISVTGYQASLDYEIAMRNLELHVSPDNTAYYPDTPEKTAAFKEQADRMVGLMDKLLENNKKRIEDKKNPLFDPQQVQQLTQLKERLSGLIPHITYADKVNIFDKILRPKVVDTAAKPAENSFKDAVMRAVGMPPEQRAQVRANAVRYVNGAHTWQEIVHRYERAVDSDDPFKALPLQFRDPTQALERPVEQQAPQPNQPMPIPAALPAGRQAGGFSPEDIDALPPRSYFQQMMDWMLFLINPVAWWRTLRLMFS